MATKREIGVNLSFTADTKEAKKELEQLQRYLADLTKKSGSTSPLGITEEISSAITKVNQLQVALQKSTTSAGKLDLGQFHQELTKANLDAQQIANSLSSLGVEGQAAFAQLAQSVALAEVPIKRTNILLNNFAVTLKNTAKWQISSNILHGFMGSLQQAYSYAQDLDKSLNNIRIVTGQNVDQMVEFAKQANASAKALSATTTAYTDAALIFYQQGLTGDAVTERTDAVIKMSNVTGDSVEEVSSYMTAIWNNFDDGSKSLEHYADVITALGAATASSSAEIAAGLEKFASIGETVGLSYEYATAALATVVATTRQSEDVVGTAFKTIFSRMQGLTLGETLDDGTDLTKYSKALAAVGVNIKTQNGELREMDDILDDLGARWQTLTKDQQAALAQTVAGTRQYTQLLALMNNWEFMQENIEVARNSEGVLQQQAEIYAESWEAARKRVKAAWQGIYDQLLDDKFFIGMTDNLAKVVDQFGSIIDAFNGLKGIVPLVSSMLLKMFGSDLSKAMTDFAYNIKLMSQTGREAIYDERQKFTNALVEVTAFQAGDTKLGDLYLAQGEAQSEAIRKTIELNAVGKDLSEQEQKILEIMLGQNQALTEQYIEQSKILEAKRFNRNEAEVQVFWDAKPELLGAGYNSGNYEENIEKAIRNTEQLDRLSQIVSRVKAEIRTLGEGNDFSGLKNSLTGLLEVSGKDLPAAFQKLYNQLENFNNNPSREAFAEIEQSLRNLGPSAKGSLTSIDKLINKIEGTDAESKKLINDLTKLKRAIQEENRSLLTANQSYTDAKNRIAETQRQIEQFKGTITTVADKIVATSRGVSTFAMSLNALNGIWNTFDSIADGSISGLEGFISILTSAGMAIPMFISSMQSLNNTLGITGLLFGAKKKEEEAMTAATIADTLATEAQTAVNQASNVTNNNVTSAIMAKITAEELDKVITGELTEAQLLENVAKETGYILDDKQRKGLLVLIAERIAHKKALDAETKSQIASNAAKVAGMASMGVIAGIAAVVAITAIAIKTYQKYQEKLKELNDATIERVNALQEEANANKELVDSYNEIYKQYKQTGEGKEQLAEISNQLVDKYHLEGAALAELTGNYTDLTEQIKAARAAELDRLQTETRSEIAAAGSNLFLDARKGRGHAFWGGDYKATFDLESSGNFTEALQNNLSNTSGVQIANTDYGENYSLFRANASTPQEIAKLYEELSAAVDEANKYMSEEERLADTGYRQVSEWLSKHREAYEEYNSAVNEFGAITTEKLFADKDLSNAQNLATAIEEVRTELEKTEDIASSEDAQKFINTYLKGISDIQRNLEKVNIAQRINEETGKAVNEVLKELDKYNDAQVAFLSIHLDTALLEEDYKDWLNKHKDILTLISQQSAQSSLQNSLKNFTSGGKMSSTDVAGLYENQDTARYLGMSQTTFEDADYGDQISTLTNAWIQSTQDIVENRDKIIDQFKEEKTAIIEENEVVDHFYQNFAEGLEETIDKAEDFEYSFEEVENALREFADFDGTLEEFKAENRGLGTIIAKYQELEDVSEDVAIARGNVANQYKNYQIQLSHLASLINQVSETEYSAKEISAAY